MVVALRAAQIIAVLISLGLPINLLLLGRASCSSSGRSPWRMPVLLAPCTGLVVSAMFTSLFLALGQPVKNATWLFWLIPALEWCVVAVVYWRTHRYGMTLRPPASWRPVAAVPVVVAGLVLVAIGFLWPFLADSRLVFWHYAGTDGYFYMQVAEYLGGVGPVIPEVGLYEPISGFVHSMLLNYYIGGYIERPGTFSMLAGLSSLLGLTPHETYSPLVVSSVCTLYLSLVALGTSLGLRTSASTLLGLFGVFSPAVWMLTTETFLGNLLVMPIMPALLLVPRPSLGLREPAYAGFLLAGACWIYPDIWLGVLAISAPYQFLLLLRSLRSGSSRAFAASIGVALGATIVCIAAMIGPLIYLSIIRLGYAVPDTALTAAAQATSEPTFLGIRPMPSWTWIWPGLNIGGLPPRALEPIEIGSLLAVIALDGLYLVVSVWRCRLTNLWCFGASLAALVIVGGLSGRFRSDYELFRGLAVFAFVPLAMLFALPNVLAGRHVVIRWLAALIVAPVLVQFARVDFDQFKMSYTTYLPDIQFTAADLSDRLAVRSLATDRSIVMATDTPSFTAFSNTLILFSSTRLAVPTSYYKLTLVQPSESEMDQQYSSSLVLRNRRYSDIYALADGARKLYESDDYDVVENDLIPFFDDDSLTVLHVFPTSVLEANHLSAARILKKPTQVAIYSRKAQSVRIEFALAPDQAGSMRFGLDGPSTATVEVVNYRVMLPQLELSEGLHKLTLEAVDGPLEIREVRIIR